MAENDKSFTDVGLGQPWTEFYGGYPDLNTEVPEAKHLRTHMDVDYHPHPAPASDATEHISPQEGEPA